MRTVGKLEEVVYRAKGCGDLGIVSSWVKKGSAIILRKIALLIVKIQKSTVNIRHGLVNMAKSLEESDQ